MVHPPSLPLFPFHCWSVLCAMLSCTFMTLMGEWEASLRLFLPVSLLGRVLSFLSPVHCWAERSPWVVIPVLYTKADLSWVGYSLFYTPDEGSPGWFIPCFKAERGPPSGWFIPCFKTERGPPPWWFIPCFKARRGLSWWVIPCFKARRRLPGVVYSLF